jgi:hypothetical protein
MSRVHSTRCSGAALIAALAIPAAAQWLHYPTPGTPRTKDGKANLSAPAPRTREGKPDLSGIWRASTGKYLNNLAADGTEAPMLPWAEAVYKERRENNSKGRPSERCLPHGLPDFDALAIPIKFIQIPGQITVLYEAYNHYRQIFLDGRPFPKDPQPTWLGYSVGKWEGDALVVDTIGFNDETWLDDGGHPHTEALRVTERMRRKDFGHMEIQVIVDDPKAYTKPWGATIPYDLLPDTELIEAVCAYERDQPHMVGK